MRSTYSIRLKKIRQIVPGVLALMLLTTSPSSLLAQTSDGPFEYDNPLSAMRESAILNGSVRVIVRMSDDAIDSAELRSATQLNSRRDGMRAMTRTMVSSSAVINRTYDSVPLVAMTVDADDLDSLARSGQIEHIYPDVEYSLTLNGSTGTIGMPPIWNQGLTGTGHAVAVVDTGVDAQHPFLAGKVIAEACFSTSRASTSMCPDLSSRQFGPGAASPYAPNCINSFGNNICNHGTHVAGIAAGTNTVTTAGIISGVAPGANIIAIQVFHLSFGSPRAYRSNIIAGLDWLDSFDGTLAGSNIASVNLSLGSGEYAASCDYQLIKNSIDNLLEDGVVTVISAGNRGRTGKVGSPGCISSAVTVAATTDGDQPASFSNIGRLVDVWAPGVSILSSVTGNQYSSYNGTSMAAPHVAGAAAVLEQQGFSGGLDVAAALSASDVTVCRNASVPDLDRCAPRLQVQTALNRQPLISEEYVSELTSTSAFVGFTSNICGYGDYSYSGGAFVAPRNGDCYERHGITLGIDTPTLSPSTTYDVTLTLTDPITGVTDTKVIQLTTLGPPAPPQISNQAVSELTPTSAFVGFESNICGYGDYAYPGGSFVAPRDGVCYSEHGITLGIDTPSLAPGTRYTVTLTLTDPDTGVTDVETVVFTTPGGNQAPRILRPYVRDLTSTSAFVGYTSNICGYGDYTHAGGSFIAPRNNICYTDHGITVGRDTPALNPGTTYTVRLILTDPATGATTSRPVTFTTPGTALSPRIMAPYVTDITQTTAFVGYTSNICGYGDYRSNGGDFIAPRSYGCYLDHGITLGRDTNTLRPSTQYTVEFALTDPVTGKVGKRPLTFTTLGPGPSPDVDNDDTPIELVKGEKTTAQYGRNFGEGKHPSRVNFNFTSAPQHLFLTYRGYDIDSPGEMTVRLNGKVLQRPRRSPDDSLSSTNSVVIDWTEVVNGTNTLSFSQDNPIDDKYGVASVRIRNLYQAPVPLNIGVRNDSKYGYAYDGESNHIGGVTYSFENPGQSLMLTVRGYDIDTRDEAQVFLNNRTLGYLRNGNNNALAPVSRFALDVDDMVAGTNSIYIIQKRPGGKYGTTAARLKAFSGPSQSLVVSTRDTNYYGYRYPGSTSDHPQTLNFGFPAMASDARLVMRGFDVDSADEVLVELNGRQLGYLKPTPNNGEAWTSFIIPQSDVAGSNQITLTQKTPGYRWGVRDVMVRPDL